MMRFLYFSPATSADTPASGSSIAESSAAVSRTTPTSDVEIALTSSCVQQYLRDLAAVDLDDPCFFTAMGALARARIEANATILAAARVAPEKAVFRPALPMCLSAGLIGQQMSKHSYKEQLQHPNWQRKRLEVMTRDDFTCQLCQDKETQLHVHHKHYVKGRMAWEYEADELVTLCWPCHESAHYQREKLMEIVARLNMDGPLSIGEATDLVAGWSDNLCGYDYSDEFSSSLGPYTHFALGRAVQALTDLPHELIVRLSAALYRVNQWERAEIIERMVMQLEGRPPAGLDSSEGLGGGTPNP